MVEARHALRLPHRDVGWTRHAQFADPPARSPPYWNPEPADAMMPVASKPWVPEPRERTNASFQRRAARRSNFTVCAV
ncbi:hypothetical protein VTN00DRAFT_19 [Thermoascus crustaceus]|uniref:uncharacterized protein n=1 Tax=Thermoascus crustaceus TaxID=5088 RepID=UPI0037448EB9